MKMFRILAVGCVLVSCQSAENSNGYDLRRYETMIDYDRQVEIALRSGGYDRFNVEITTQNFPGKESGKRVVHIALVRIGRFATIDGLIEEYRKRGLRPATLKELLALGEQYPALQKENAIIGLASVWHQREINWMGNQSRTPIREERLSYAYLDSIGDKRIVDLYWNSASHKGLGPDEFRTFLGCFIDDQVQESQ